MVRGGSPSHGGPNSSECDNTKPLSYLVVHWLGLQVPSRLRALSHHHDNNLLSPRVFVSVRRDLSSISQQSSCYSRSWTVISSVISPNMSCYHKWLLCVLVLVFHNLTVVSHKRMSRHSNHLSFCRRLFANVWKIQQWPWRDKRCARSVPCCSSVSLRSLWSLHICQDLQFLRVRDECALWNLPWDYTDYRLVLCP